MRRILALVIAAAALVPVAARAQENGYPFRLANFSLELLGGWSKLSPTDLNSTAEYEEAYLHYYYVTRFNYYKLVNGEDYQVSTVRTGDVPFRPITGGLMYGFRLRYDLSPSLGLSLGWQALDRQQRSNVGMSIGVTDAGRDNIDYNGPRAYGYQNSGFLLGASAWTPQIAAHFGWQLGPVLRFEALVAFGPLFVSTRIVSERDMSTTDASGFVSGTRTILDMKGTATGFTGEIGARMCIRTGGLLDMFVEGAFSFRDASEISGPGWSRTVAYDSNGAQDASESSWSGTWGISRTQINSAWGQFSEIVPQNRISAGFFQGIGKFAFSLSGLQVKAGLAIHL